MEKVTIREGGQIWAGIEYGHNIKLDEIEFVEYKDYEKLLEDKHSLQQVIQRLHEVEDELKLYKQALTKAVASPIGVFSRSE